MTRTNHPKIGFNFLPSIFLESETPNNMPRTESALNDSKNVQSMVTLSNEK